MSETSIFDMMFAPPRPSLDARLDVALPEDPVEFHRVVRRWLELGVETLAAHKVASLLAAPELPSKSLSRHLGAFGEPGTPWCSLVVHTDTASGGWGGSLRAWTPKNWENFLSRDLAKFPRGVEVKFSELDEHGDTGAGDYVHLEVHRDEDMTEWTSLMAHREPLPEVEDRDALALLWLDFLTRVATELAGYVRFGCIGEDLTTQPTTPLEQALRHVGGEALAQGRLRGYSWVTILGSAALERVGGVGELQRSGAFHEVTDLGSGTVLVRATPHPSQYDDEAVAKVFRALAPALPAGEPWKDGSGFGPEHQARIPPDYRKLVWADAASVPPAER